MEVMVAVLIYLLAIPLWCGIWSSANGFTLMRSNRLLTLPFCMSLIYLAGNALLLIVFGGQVSSPGQEEARIGIIVTR